MSTQRGVAVATFFLLLQEVSQDSCTGITLVLPTGSSHLGFLHCLAPDKPSTLGVISVSASPLPQNLGSPKVNLGIFHIRILGAQPRQHRTDESLGSAGEFRLRTGPWCSTGISWGGCSLKGSLRVLSMTTTA